MSFERQPYGVSRFVSQAKPRELTNRKPQQRVTAIIHDQRTPTSSLPVMYAFGVQATVVCAYLGSNETFS